MKRLLKDHCIADTVRDMNKAFICDDVEGSSSDLEIEACLLLSPII